MENEKKKKPQRKLTKEEIAQLQQAIDQLNGEFPTEDAIADEVFRITTENKTCACGCTKFSRILNEKKRRASCEGCGVVFYYTAGSFFEDMHILRAPLFTMYLANRAIIYNAYKIHQLLKVSYSTAHWLCLKVASLAFEGMKKVAKEMVEVISIELDPVLNRRSTETDARQHPHTEREKELKQFIATANGVNQIRQQIHELLETTDADDLYEDEQKVYDELSKSSKTFEEITEGTSLSSANTTAALSTLILCDLVTKLPDEKYEQSMNTNNRFFASSSPRLYYEVEKAKWFISKVFDGVSRRYLQLYLAMTWSAFGRNNLKDNCILNQCAKENSFLKNLRTYVSPIVVALCPV